MGLTNTTIEIWLSTRTLVFRKHPFMTTSLSSMASKLVFNELLKKSIYSVDDS